MKNTSLTKSLPALLALTGGTLAATTGKAQAATATQPLSCIDALEERIRSVQERLAHQQPALSFEQKTSEDGLDFLVG